MSNIDTTSQPSLTAANTATTIRAFVIALGGYAIGKNWLTNEQVSTIAGIAVIVVPLVWGFFKNASAKKALTAAIAAPSGSAG